MLYLMAISFKHKLQMSVKLRAKEVYLSYIFLTILNPCTPPPWHNLHTNEERPQTQAPQIDLLLPTVLLMV
jgi:hypothetical protein